MDVQETPRLVLEVSKVIQLSTVLHEKKINFQKWLLKVRIKNIDRLLVNDTTDSM